MKLSEAMMLGSATCKMVPADWNSCALGAAANAVGIPTGTDDLIRIDAMVKSWPWLRGNDGVYNRAFFQIWYQFDTLVCNGKMTYEQLVDYVKSVEPDCGECNKFECTCEKKEVEVERSASVLG